MLGFTRRVFLGGLFAGLATGGHAKAPEVSLRPKKRPTAFAPRTAPNVDSLVASAELGGNVTFSVVDINSGKTLESRGGSTALPPASVTKAVTALYALNALGPDFRFETRLVATRGVSNGVVQGDLILAGGGDPTLDTDALASLAAKLKQAGIREVRGTLRVWGGALPFERILDDRQPESVSYNPAISGLNLNYNRVHFEWKRVGGDYTVAMDARSAKYRPDVRVARISVAPRSLPVYTYTDKGDHDSWTVARDALGNGGARWLPVRKPEAYAAEVFATFARSQGIRLKVGRPLSAAPGGEVVAWHRSPKLTAILQGMLKFSNNLTAELVGMTATARLQGRPQPLKQSAKQMSAWARDELGMVGAKLVDHSGLHETSRLTAEAMAKALARVYGQGALKPILKDIPMRHQNGKVNAGHPVKVAAKTGTLYFVSSLAGYMSTARGKDMAFAIFTANNGLRASYDPTSGQRPQGSRGWNSRSKALQQKLIERWDRYYGS
ncbi:MAG: D-alanyl-D-alanine carboxypeptidase/D-alanyl-D-alanine-endopeptidase [Pseudomonadota bacterium]